MNFPFTTVKSSGLRLKNVGLFLLMMVSVLAFSPDTAVAQNSVAHQQFVFAYRLLQRQEHKLAAEAFDEYLSRFPKDEKYSDALYYRALLARTVGHNREALGYLGKALAPKHVPDHAVLFLKGQIYSDLSMHDRAVQTLEMIDLQTLDSDTRASIYYLRGKSYRGLKNLPAAVTQLKEVIKIDSSLRPRAMLDMARIQVLLKLPADALETLKDCLKLNNPVVSAEAARLAGDLAFQMKMYPAALGYYQTILTQYTASPHLSSAIVGSLWSQFEQKQYSQVLATFEQYKKNLDAASRVTGWYLAGASQQEMGRHDQAVALFGAILAAASGSDIEDKVLYRFAASQFETAQFSGMNRTIAKLRRAFPDSPRLADAGFLMASAALKQGDTATAAARFTAMVDTGQRHPYYTQSLLQRGRLYETTGKFEPAVADYQAYVAAYPTAENQVKLAASTVWQAILRLVDLNYQLRHFEAADQVAAKLLAVDKLDPLLEAEGLYRRALAQIRLKQFEVASASLTTLLTKHPENHYRADATYYRGLLGLSLKKSAEALADFQAAASSDKLAEPLKINALRLAAMLLRKNEQTELAFETLARLEKLVARTGLGAEELIWVGGYYIDKAKPDDALGYLMPVLEAKVDSSRYQLSEAMMLAAGALRTKGQLDRAIDAFSEVVSMSQGHGYQARLELAKTLAVAKRFDEAVDEYEGLIAAEQTKVAARALFELGQLHRLLVQNSLRESDAIAAQQQRDAAVKSFKRLVLLFSFPEISPLPQLSQIEIAELASESDTPEDARGVFAELIEQYPDTPYATYATAVVAMMDSRKIVATGLLKKVRDAKEIDPQLAQRVANHLKVLGGGR